MTHDKGNSGKSRAKKYQEQYMNDLNRYAEIVKGEILRVREQINPLIDWIRKVAPLFRELFVEFSEYDEMFSDKFYYFSTALMSLRSSQQDKLADEYTDRLESIKKEYSSFIHPLMMRFNALLNRINSLDDDFRTISSKLPGTFAKLSEVDRLSLNFNRSVENIEDIAVELNNEILNLKRAWNEMNSRISTFNDMVNSLKRINASVIDRRADTFELKAYPGPKIPPYPREKVVKIDHKKLIEQIKKKDRIHSRIIRELTPELKELQRVHKTAAQAAVKAVKAGVKGPSAGKKPIRIVSYKELYLPLNKDKIPLYDINTGRFMGFTSP